MSEHLIDPYWFPGSPMRSGNIKIQPIFLCHIPKTGSLTVMNAIRHSFEANFHIIKTVMPSFEEPLIMRCDDTKFLADGRFNDPYVFVASHLPFGFHTKFPNPFNLITILRDPFSRVRSLYTYHCMRSDEAPSRQAFETMFRDSSNINCMTKQLSGKLPHETLEEGSLDRAIENLNNAFLMYGTTSHIAQITTNVLKMNHLPNVLIDHTNKTEKKYLLNADDYEQEIRDLNWSDEKLYAYVRENPRVDINDGIGGLDPEEHSYTVLIRESKNDVNGVTLQKRLCETKIVKPLIINGRCPKYEFDNLFNE